MFTFCDVKRNQGLNCYSKQNRPGEDIVQEKRTTENVVTLLAFMFLFLFRKTIFLLSLARMNFYVL